MALRRILPWLGALVAGVVIGLWHPGQRDGFWGGVEAQLLDARFALRGPITAPDGVAVVQIGDADIARLGGFPLSRDALAMAVDTIAASGAAAIAVDLLLVDPLPGDDALAAALARIDRYALAIAAAPQPQGAPPPALDDAIVRSGFDVVVGIPNGIAAASVGPSQALTASARLGHVNFSPESDGSLLRLPASVPLLTRDGPIQMPTLAMAALRASDPDAFAPLVLRTPATALSGSVDVGGMHVPLDDFGSIPLVFYGPEATIPTWLWGGLDQVDLTGQVVFLGLAGTGMGDRHPTPFDATFPGVEAHATLAGNILENRHLQVDRATWLVDIMLAVVFALLGMALAATQRPLPAAMAVAGVAVVLGGILQASFLAGWWLDGTTIVLALVFGSSLGTVLRLVRQQSRAANLARYVSPVLSDALAEGGRLSFEGRTQEAVALFVDIEGSTSRGETDSPEQTAHFLRRFHEAVARAVARHNGVVEQFIGDGAMVIFGLPEPGPNDAASALACIDAVFAEVASGDDPIPIRVGAHMGLVRADVLGGAQQRQVAITGDVVNVASRLQELAKTEGARVVLSDTLLQSTRASQHWIARLGLQELELQTLRGRRTRLHVWAGPGPDLLKGPD